MLQLLFGEGDWLGSGRSFAFCIAPKSTGKTSGVRAAAQATSPGFAALIHMVQGQDERELPVWAARLGGQYGQARGGTGLGGLLVCSMNDGGPLTLVVWYFGPKGEQQEWSWCS